MKHLFIALSVVLLLAVSITACSPAAEDSGGENSRSSSVAQPEQTEYLEEIPTEYFLPDALHRKPVSHLCGGNYRRRI